MLYKKGCGKDKSYAIITLMKKFLTFKNIIFLMIVLVLLLGMVWLLNRNRKIQTSAATIAQLAGTRALLSAYLAENGVYPESRQFQSLNIGYGDTSAVFIYNSFGARYQIDFNLPISLGAFKTKGPYCATEKGILVGKCD